MRRPPIGKREDPPLRPLPLLGTAPSSAPVGGSRMSQEPDAEPAGPHRPVMLAEVLDVFRGLPPGPVVDATVGAAGHSSALLDAFGDRTVVGLDRDADALEEASRALARFGDRAVLRHARFDSIAATVGELGHRSVAGVLFDLGVSSMQFDRAERGFSYRADAPLDMRMDRRQALTAADVVNHYGVEQLADLLATHGGERFAGRVARAIVAARPVNTTLELADVVRVAIPAATRRRGPHPARRTFQALRIEVNEELAILAESVDQAVDVLAPGGRCAVLAYHSGEDRIVKQRFTEAATGGCLCPPSLPCGCGAQPTVSLVWRGARRPSDDEVASNPRAASARFRVAEKLAPADSDRSASDPVPPIPGGAL